MYGSSKLVTFVSIIILLQRRKFVRHIVWKRKISKIKFELNEIRIKIYFKFSNFFKKNSFHKFVTLFGRVIVS